MRVARAAAGDRQRQSHEQDGGGAGQGAVHVGHEDSFLSASLALASEETCAAGAEPELRLREVV